MERSSYLKTAALLLPAMLMCQFSGAQHRGAEVLAGAESPRPGPRLQINNWHGLHQKVGHKGHAQNDFNLIGNVAGFAELDTLTYSLNGTAPVGLNIGLGKFGDDRRLAAAGDFNADIPVSLLREGRNSIVVKAKGPRGHETSVTVYVEKLEGTYPLPVLIKWTDVGDPQNVGQYVDGKWAIEEGGLRTLQTGYDRVFLIGDTTWQDYEVSVPFTVHRVDTETGPVSGGNGLGLLMRFTGHVNGGPGNFPTGQPKWGYQPFGCIGFLRWEKNEPDGEAFKQFYRGDKNHIENYGTIAIKPGNVYHMRMRCVTLPDEGVEGVTRYSWKIWQEGETETSAWDWEVVQKSEHALRNGGLVLLAHHVDISFGNVTVEVIGEK
ncbi:MAG: hypothetical protein WEB30_09705 [Cyclobacteriaceae bacterium]